MANHAVIIDPGAHTPELDCFNHLSLISPLALTYHLPALHGMGSLHNESENIKAIVILGSSTSVHDNKDWQASLVDWLKDHQKTPTLGICYGHQLIAHMFGGLVDFVYTDNRKLNGFREVQIDPIAPWGNKKRQGKLVVSHRETVTSCPDEMQVIAKSEEIAIEGLAHKTLPIWTLQAHPEATPQFLDNQHIAQPENENAFRFGMELMRDFLTSAAN